MTNFRTLAIRRNPRIAGIAVFHLYKALYRLAVCRNALFQYHQHIHGFHILTKMQKR